MTDTHIVTSAWNWMTQSALGTAVIGGLIVLGHTKPSAAKMYLVGLDGQKHEILMDIKKTGEMKHYGKINFGLDRIAGMDNRDGGSIDGPN